MEVKNWIKELKKPILLQAPLDGVSDFVFRNLLLEKYQKPDIMFTEFTSLKQIMMQSRDSVFRLSFSKQSNIPLIAQVWSKDPQDFYDGALILNEMGFCGIDINMGCPSEKMIKKGACSYMIKDKAKAKECISALKEGLKKDMSISVKTRIGFDKIDMDWPLFLLEQNLDFITFHGRTQKQKSEGIARWDLIKEIALSKNSFDTKTLIFGNGDIKNKKQAIDFAKEYQVDGVMIGRAIVKNPYFFEGKDFTLSSKKEILFYMKKYLEDFNLFYQGERSFQELKKTFKYYMKEFPREELLSVLTKNESESCLEAIDCLIKNEE